MKKLLTIAVTFFLFSFTTQTQKSFNIQFSEADLNKHWQKLNGIKQIAEESNLPHQQVKFIIQSIDSLQMTIGYQVQQQLKDTTKKSK